MPNPRLFPAHSGRHNEHRGNEYEVIAPPQIIGRIALLCNRSKPWFWLISLPFRGDRRHPWLRAKR